MKVQLTKSDFKKKKMKKTFDNLTKLEMLTRQVSNDLISQDSYDHSYLGENLKNYADWVKREKEKLMKEGR